MAREKTYKNETDVKKEIKRLLDKHKWFHWVTPSNGMGSSGIPDRIAVRAGVILVIEAKFGKNRPTQLQKAFLQSIMAESGFGFVVNEATLPWLATWLETFDRAQNAVVGGEKPSHDDGGLLMEAVRVLTEQIV